MRALVDGCIKVVASPASFTAAGLATALLNWPAVRDLTLLGVGDASVLAPLSTVSLARASPCARCLWMPDCVKVSDLSPLGASSKKLEELWMAGSVQVGSLVPLKACPEFRKLDLRSCVPALHNQLHDLGLTCTQLADPSSVVVPGLVHALQPSIRPDSQARAADELMRIALEGGPDAHAAIAAAGAIPALVQLLGSDTLAVISAAACVLCLLAATGDQNRASIVQASALPGIHITQPSNTPVDRLIAGAPAAAVGARSPQPTARIRTGAALDGFAGSSLTVRQVQQTEA
ncbi:hypothetical protein FOA52_014853 [Chlamydomonas sp. UWO 241]|nr:hypothetical protein FOA52_014853 [Chlamydomonas sp. UWO 241]